MLILGQVEIAMYNTFKDVLGIPAAAVKTFWDWVDPANAMVVAQNILVVVGKLVAYISPGEVATTLDSAVAFLGGLQMVNALRVGLWFIDPLCPATLIVALFKAWVIVWLMSMLIVLTIWVVDAVRKILGFVPFAGMGGGGS